VWLGCPTGGGWEEQAGIGEACWEVGSIHWALIVQLSTAADVQYLGTTPELGWEPTLTIQPKGPRQDSASASSLLRLTLGLQYRCNTSKHEHAAPPLARIRPSHARFFPPPLLSAQQLCLRGVISDPAQALDKAWLVGRQPAKT
jgi:hypothetical protein